MDIWQELEEENFEKQAGILKKMAKSDIRLFTAKSREEEFAAGESKIGGHPHLPTGIEWPSANGKPLLFIAQINLQQITEYDIDGFLPAKGILYFFHSGQVWGYDPAHKGEFKVFYHNGDLTQLQPVRLPDRPAHCFEPCKITFQKENSYPSYSALRDYKPEFFDGKTNEWGFLCCG